MLNSEFSPLPERLYARLQHLAKQRRLEPALLLEQLLDWAETSSLSTEWSNPETPAPIYRLHECAKDLGIVDLAQNIDHYLYGLPKVK